jgi:hypothetical protein
MNLLQFRSLNFRCVCVDRFSCLIKIVSVLNCRSIQWFIYVTWLCVLNDSVVLLTWFASSAWKFIWSLVEWWAPVYWRKTVNRYRTVAASAWNHLKLRPFWDTDQLTLFWATILWYYKCADLKFLWAASCVSWLVSWLTQTWNVLGYYGVQ